MNMVCVYGVKIVYIYRFSFEVIMVVNVFSFFLEVELNLVVEFDEMVFSVFINKYMFKVIRVKVFVIIRYMLL